MIWFISIHTRSFSRRSTETPDTQWGKFPVRICSFGTRRPGPMGSGGTILPAQLGSAALRCGCNTQARNHFHSVAARAVPASPLMSFRTRKGRNHRGRCTSETVAVRNFESRDPSQQQSGGFRSRTICGKSNSGAGAIERSSWSDLCHRSFPIGHSRRADQPAKYSVESSLRISYG